MKVRRVLANNRKKAFIVETSKARLEYPYSRLHLRPQSSDPIVHVGPDRELANEAFTYVLRSGKSESVHLDSVLEYHQDPDYICELLLHVLTAQALDVIERQSIPKRELARRFIAYVENNYVVWMGRMGGNSDLHSWTVRRKILPLLQKDGKCVLIVMGGLRLSQWLYLQKKLEPWFHVENSTAWAPLPPESLFCRSALFSGLMSRDVSRDQPQLWRRLCEGGDENHCQRELLKLHLRKQGVDLEDIRFIHVKTSQDAGSLAENLQTDANARLIVVVVEFMEMLDVWRRDNPRDPAPKEKDVRTRAGEWFESSGMADAMRSISESRRAVVLTSDHGTVRADSPAEVFCQEEKSAHPRVKIGANISCDERQALFIESPSQYGLPGMDGELAYAIAKENFYFVYPNKFQYFVTQFKDQMVSGGLSMEEMIVPLATLTPR